MLAPGSCGGMEAMPLAPRLARLPRRRLHGREVPVAIGPPARLLGLAWLPRERAGSGLLLPRCASVHTFGMRFALDLFFLDAEERVLAVHRSVRRGHVVGYRRARAVLEIPAAQGGEITLSGT